MEKLRLYICNFYLETTPLICSLYQIFSFIQRCNHILDGASILYQYISDLTSIAFAFHFYIIGCLSLRNFFPKKLTLKCLCFYAFKCILWAFLDFIRPGTKCAAEVGHEPASPWAQRTLMQCTIHSHGSDMWLYFLPPIIDSSNKLLQFTLSSGQHATYNCFL